MLVKTAALFEYPLELLVLNHSKSNFVSSRLEATLTFLRAQCESSIVLVIDAYDIFFAQPAGIMLDRFHAANASVVWSMETSYANQDAKDQSFFDAMAAVHDAFGRPRGVPYSYLNSGGYLGVAGVVADAVEAALSVQPGARGWHNKTCGEASGRLCADQWSFGHMLGELHAVSFAHDDVILLGAPLLHGAIYIPCALCILWPCGRARAQFANGLPHAECHAIASAIAIRFCFAQRARGIGSIHTSTTTGRCFTWRARSSGTLRTLYDALSRRGPV